MNELIVEFHNQVLILEFQYDILIENVVRLIENRPTLMKFQFPVNVDVDRDALFRKFKRDWHIESIADNDQNDAFVLRKKMY